MVEVRVARWESLNPRRGQLVEVEGWVLGVFRVGDGAVVLDGVCPHTGGPLGAGDVADGCVTCPFHGWTFSLESGANVRNPDNRVRRHPARVVDGEVLVELPDGPPPEHPPTWVPLDEAPFPPGP